MLLLGFTPYSFQIATLRFTFLACDKGDIKENFNIQCVLKKRLRELLYCNLFYNLLLFLLAKSYSDMPLIQRKRNVWL